MRQLNGFGARRRARREQHHANVVWVGELRSGIGRARGRDELVGRDHLLACTDDDIAVLRVGDHERGGEPVDQLPQAVLAEPVVQRRERDARAGGREQQQRQHDAARTDVRRVLGAGRCDDSGPAVGEFAQFSCGQADLAGHHRGTVRIRRRRHFQQQRDTHSLSTKISRMGLSPPP